MRDRAQDHVHGDRSVIKLRAADVDAGRDAARDVSDFDPARARADVLASLWARRPGFDLDVVRVDHSTSPAATPRPKITVTQIRGNRMLAGSVSRTFSMRTPSTRLIQTPRIARKSTRLNNSH